jgi:hypothetical protein
MSLEEKWYHVLQKDSPTFRQVFQRSSNKTCFVRDVQLGLEVLDSHKNLTSILENPNGTYYKLNNKNTNPWVPLLPGYTIFSCVSSHYIKMSIVKDRDNKLWFCWHDYGSDQNFRNEVATGQDQSMFSTLRSHLGTGYTHSMPFIFGLTQEPIIKWLQSVVANKYPGIFAEEKRQLKAAERTERAVRTVKRKSEQVICNLASENIGIQAGVLVNQQGIAMSSKESQALIVMNQELHNQQYNDQRTIKKLRHSIAGYNEGAGSSSTPQPTAMEVDSIIDTVLATAELGSTIIVDTRKYMALLLSTPCPTCLDTYPANKTFHVTCPSGLAVQCRITCNECKKAETHSNEPEGVDLSMCIAAAGLAGGVNHYALTKIFAIMGVTRQPSQPSFHKYQQTLSPIICQSAKESAAKAFNDVLEYLKQTDKKTLSVSFDVSWSHVRNANEASGEFIFQGNLPGKLVITFNAHLPLSY